jgi:hypothetical protein
MIQRLVLAVYLRMVELKDPLQRERGDGPVPSAIIIAGLAILATAVVAWAGIKARDAMNSAP